MRRVRLGQTEHGSFVVTMMTPVPPMLQYPLLDRTWVDFEEEPYERQVTRRLVGALEASRDAAEKVHSGDDATAFENAVSAGVSANLCNAVSKLLYGSSGLEISVSWAKTRPLLNIADAFGFRKAMLAPSVRPPASILHENPNQARNSSAR